MIEDSTNRKLARLGDGARPRVLDLFSGCGGISLGFHAAGFEIAAAVENDATAALSHALNFHRHGGSEHFELHARPRDITEMEPEQLVAELGLGAVETAVDVVVGGPPCQAFARVGRSKLREIAAHPTAFRQDKRASLYIRYLDYVRRLKPLAIFMENVPDVMNYGGHNIPEEMCEVLDDLGYVGGYTLMNAVHYGVPQTRERLFLIAWRRELAVPVTFPAATHRFELPPGYAGTRNFALKSLKANPLFDRFWVATPQSGASPKDAVTAEDAIGDLPRITDHLDGRMRRGVRRFSGKLPYRDDVELSDYARAMRRWDQYEAADGVADHVIRYLPRDFEIFRHMRPGDQYPEALRIAVDLHARGVIPSVPPYDPGKFPNKWRKLERTQPARTLMAHLGKDSYSHIHYDDDQARTISVREAARLQSFPDGFRFAGTMNPAFRQIGNAVPPLMARAVAAAMLDVLRRAADIKGSRQNPQPALLATG